MYDHAVTDGNVRSDLGWKSWVSVDHGQFLNIGAIANRQRCFVTAQDGSKPAPDIGTELDVPDHVSARRDPIRPGS